jgi:hypothetical protein
LAPRGNVHSSFTPRGEHSLLFRKTEEQTEDLRPQGLTSTLANKVKPWGTTSHLGGPWGEIKNRPQGPMASVSKLCRFPADGRCDVRNVVLRKCQKCRYDKCRDRSYKTPFRPKIWQTNLKLLP